MVYDIIYMGKKNSICNIEKTVQFLCSVIKGKKMQK